MVIVMKRQMEIYKFCESQVLSVSPFCQCIFLYLLFNIFSLFSVHSRCYKTLVPISVQ